MVGWKGYINVLAPTCALLSAFTDVHKRAEPMLCTLPPEGPDCGAFAEQWAGNLIREFTAVKLDAD